MIDDPDLYSWNNTIFEEAEEELMAKLNRKPSYEEVMEYMDERSRIDPKDEKEYNLAKIYDRKDNDRICRFLKGL